jgi:hypothetical protein
MMREKSSIPSQFVREKRGCVPAERSLSHPFPRQISPKLSFSSPKI